MLENKIIVITGGAGLLGSAFVKAVLANKGKAIIADINSDKGQELEQNLHKEYGKESCAYRKLDVTSKDSVQQLIDQTEAKYGHIDALVNAAYARNASFGKDFFEVEHADFCDNLCLQLGGYFLTSQQFATYFKDKGKGGNIINIASIYGVVAPKFEIYEGTEMTCPIEYTAVKSALIMMTRTMAKRFKGMNIRVNSISPGGILDGQDPKFLAAYKAQCISKGMLDVKDIEGCLVFLLSDQSQYINGQNIVVDDGFTL